MNSPKASAATGTKTEDRIQILDLHTRSPVISYRNQIYTAQWTDTIGTDILLTTPDSSSPFPPQHSYPEFDIQAITSIKLVGRPVQLIPRGPSKSSELDTTNAPSNPAVPTTSNEASSSSQIANPPQSQPPLPYPRIPVNMGDSLSRQNQARFLQRLIAAKASKGEADSVTVYSKRRHTGSGWRSWGQVEAEEDDQDEEGQDLGERHDQDEEAENDNATPVTPSSARARSESQQTSQVRSPAASQTPRRLGRPPGKRKMVKPRKPGGLFRDYVPEVGDKAGADIRGFGLGERVGEGRLAVGEETAGRSLGREESGVHERQNGVEKERSVEEVVETAVDDKGEDVNMEDPS